MVEGAGRDNSIGDEEAHPEIWTLGGRYDKRRWTEEGLKVWEAIFYAYDRMVASTDPGWTQTSFYTLTGLFDRVGPKKNVQKTVGMF